MSSFAKNCRSTVIPALRYRDAPAAIEWLCQAFGFEKNAVYANEDGTIGHAQLTFGNGMIMLSSAIPGSPFSEVIRQPEDMGGVETQTPCLIVSDCDAIYRTAKAASAAMLMDLEEKDYGGKAFTCRDPEGHIWNIGTYDPWG
jgi:uncharacterized glyoxalase superfamily protein PhnB